MISRYFVSFNLATFITFGLFLGMHFLISTGEVVLLEQKIRPKIDFGGVRKAEPPADKKIIAPVPQDIIEVPPIPDIEFTGIDTGGPAIGEPNIAVNPSVKLVNKQSAFGVDGDFIPIVKPAPQYPIVMQEKGIEGFVRVQFTVTKEGMTSDVVVVSSSHQGFERNAIKAAQNFKFKPRVVNGEAVTVTGVFNLIEFKLGN